MDLIVGTFNHESLFTLHFSPPTAANRQADLSIVRTSPATGFHSWLALSKNQKYLYATAWTKPPTISAYQIRASGRELRHLNSKHVASWSGYICVNATHLFSVGGPSGEVFRLENDGSIGALVQRLDFVTGHGANVSERRDQETGIALGSFGGLRHGAHSVDLSPDGRSLYVPDIGRNCIWTYSVQPATQLRDLLDPPLKFGTKRISPRENDGPRHSWPHPNGRWLYCLQEHTSMIDVFSIAADGVTLEHAQAARIIPADKDAKDYWSDEVRLDLRPDASKPRYLYASARGLEAPTKGYVTVWALDDDGRIVDQTPIHIWETPTSGGLANATEPAPYIRGQDNVQYIAMTDSEEGWVFMLSFDGKEIKEVARVNLGKTESGEVIGAAMAVWLSTGGGGIQFSSS